MRQKKTMRRMGLSAPGLATVLGMRNSPGNSFIPSRVRAVCLGFALLGLSSAVAQAQVITEFSAGITASARPYGITTGPDGNLWRGPAARRRLQAAHVAIRLSGPRSSRRSRSSPRWPEPLSLSRSEPRSASAIRFPPASSGRRASTPRRIYERL